MRTDFEGLNEKAKKNFITDETWDDFNEKEKVIKYRAKHKIKVEHKKNIKLLIEEFKKFDEAEWLEKLGKLRLEYDDKVK